MQRRRLSVQRAHARLEADAVMPNAFATGNRLIAGLTSNSLAGFQSPSADDVLAASLTKEDSPGDPGLGLATSRLRALQATANTNTHASTDSHAPRQEPHSVLASWSAARTALAEAKPVERASDSNEVTPGGHPSKVGPRSPEHHRDRPSVAQTELRPAAAVTLLHAPMIAPGLQAIGDTESPVLDRRDLIRLANRSAADTVTQQVPRSTDSPATEPHRASAGRLPQPSVSTYQTAPSPAQPSEPQPSSGLDLDLAPTAADIGRRRSAQPPAASGPLRLRDLASQFNSTDEAVGTPATSPDAVTPSPNSSPTPPTAELGTAHPNPAPEPAVLAALEVEHETRLLAMIERGLRSEARRYGLDLDSWGMQ